jgi:hypothetical protein
MRINQTFGCIMRVHNLGNLKNCFEILCWTITVVPYFNDNSKELIPILEESIRTPSLYPALWMMQELCPLRFVMRSIELSACKHRKQFTICLLPYLWVRKSGKTEKHFTYKCLIIIKGASMFSQRKPW